MRGRRKNAGRNWRSSARESTRSTALRLELRFQMRDLVAQGGGLLVVLGLHGALQAGVKRLELVVVLRGAQGAGGGLALVCGALVHVLEDHAEALREGHVALRAAEPAGLLEIGLGEAA